MIFYERFSVWLAGLEPARRTRLAIAVAVALVAAVLASVWASEESYSALVEGRGYEAALTAAAAVDAAGISYRIDGDRLLVPSSRLGAARAAVSEESRLPGLADVSKLQLGLTPQAQEWAFMRAAEGDIARMINGIEGILASQVHVVPRATSLYVGEERPASASVFVELEPGGELRPGQIRAIVNLVANAVDGLDADHVSVADDRGNLLAGGDAAEGEGASGEMRSIVAYRSALEGRYERAVAQALLPVLGYGGGFSVTSTVDLDLTSRDTTTRQVDGDRQAVVSEVSEETSDTRARSGGVPGVDANLPEGAAPAAPASGAASTRTANTVNYTYPTVDEVLHRPMGGIQRLSVAVQVDSARIAALVEGSAGKLDAAALQEQIDASVRAAVGYDEARKDQVRISYLPFTPAVWTEGDIARPDVAGVVVDSLPYAVLALALGLVFWFVVRPIVSAALAPPEPVIDPLTLIAVTPEPETDDNLAMRLKALADNYEPVDASGLNRLVDGEAELAADIIRKWSTAAR